MKLKSLLPAILAAPMLGLSGRTMPNENPIPRELTKYDLARLKRAAEKRERKHKNKPQ